MLNHLDNYFYSQPEPHQSCLLFLRQFILSYDKHFTEQYKFSTPFYYYKNKWCCYLSVNKKKQLYVGVVYGNQLKHPKLKAEGRKQIKFFYIDPEKDVDVRSLKQILKLTTALAKYK